ncbi:GntR family transcriptional regulator [Peribacillus cavernae]|nr:GntR family transcriptional regulator [Peribacillus cavernae]
MPTEKQLSEDFEVSRVTIRQSMRILEEQRMIVRKQGVGTFVSETVTLQPIVFSGYIEDIMLQQLSTKVSDVTIEEIIPNEEIRTNLCVPAGETIVKVERTRQVGEKIISYVENFFSKEIASQFTEEEVKMYSFVELLYKYGYEQESALQTVSAVDATTHVAAKLQVLPESSVLFTEIIIFDRNGTPINIVNVYNHSDYKYTVKLAPSIGRTKIDQLNQDLNQL